MAWVPLPILKSADARVRWVQVRRIRCLLCEAPFVYVYSDRLVGRSVPGVALLSSDEQMERKALLHASAEFRETILSEYAGRAAGPHCGMLQPWMVITGGRRSWGSKLAAFAGAVVALAMTMLVAAAFRDARWFRDIGGLLWIGMPVLGMWVGHWLYVWTVSRPKRLEDEDDPRAMTDEKFDRWLRACSAEGDDPVRTWSNRVRLTDPLDDRIVSAGILDLLGEQDFGPLATEKRLG